MIKKERALFFAQLSLFIMAGILFVIGQTLGNEDVRFIGMLALVYSNTCALIRALLRRARHKRKQMEVAQDNSGRL